MTKYIFLALSFLCIFAGMSCKKNPVAPPPDESFVLTVTDVNCTEAWLTIHVGSGFTTHTAQLTRDTAVVASITLIGTDTTIADTELSPSHTYTYRLSLPGATSVTTKATSMDTTSHNFTWQMFTLGGASSSALYDVAIINDTLAYAVGQMFLNDSTGQIDQQPYNLATWDGTSWKIQKVPYYYQGQAFYGPIYSLEAFNANDIWFGIGNMIHWDGQSFNAVELPTSVWGPNRINKIWGLSTKNFYIVGDGGSIAHYNGTSWTKIESGTALEVRDIWGAQNVKTGNLEIYATAGDPAISPDRTVFQISGITAQAISTAGIFWALNGIWFSPGQYYWLVGDGTWEKHPTLSASSWSSQTLTSYTIDAVRGNATNDVFMCGAYGEFLHFNGVSWKSYISQTGMDGAYGGLAVHGNTVIAVGEEAPQAVILMGKR
jgi:hypothetical protein